MKENSRDLLQKRLEHLTKVCKKCLSDGGSRESKCPAQFRRKRKSSKRSDRALVRLSLGGRKLTSHGLVRELTDITGDELSASTARKRLLENRL